MNKTESQLKQAEKHTSEKAISLAPLSTTEALRGLLKVKPVKGKTLTKASKKRTAKKTAKA